MTRDKGPRTKMGHGHNLSTVLYLYILSLHPHNEDGLMIKLKDWILWCKSTLIHWLLTPQKRKLKEGVDGEKKKKKRLVIGPDGEKIVVKRGRKPLDKNKLKYVR